MIRGHVFRQQEKHAADLMGWKVTRWAGWASIAASVGTRKAKKPESWFALPGEKKQFDQKYIEKLKKRTKQVVQKHKEKGLWQA